MATDIAFAMGVFGFFKSRMPAGAQAFLLTLATVDDLGAIAVIAVLCVLLLAIFWSCRTDACVSLRRPAASPAPSRFRT